MFVKNNFKILLLFKCFLYLFLLSYPLNLKVESKNIENEKKDPFLDYIEPSCQIPILNTNNDPLLKTNKLKIEIPNLKRWTKHLLRAKTNISPNITKKYKKKFKAQLVIQNNNKRECIYPAKIRISGDWKDHIILDNNNNSIISSMDVTLLKDNIDGITKFKLFIPKTRGYDNEIISANLMKELGYLSPRTRYIEVEMNNKFYKMIIQEKFNKEFI